MSKLQDYFHRIRPVVGNVLQSKSIAIVNPTSSCLISDAFARCGLTKQTFLSSQNITTDDMFTMTYGQEFIGMNSAQALEQVIVAHNSLLPKWDIIDLSNVTTHKLYNALARRKIDLIVGGGSWEDCNLVNQLAVSLKIPAISSCLCQNLSVNGSIFIYHPQLPDAWQMSRNQLFNKKVIDKPTIHQRLMWLEIADIVMNMSKAILFRNSEYERLDIEKLVFQEQRTVILRGTTNWPWQVSYVNPVSGKTFLQSIWTNVQYPTPNPLPLLSDQKVMVVGCGTGSLLVGELPNYFNHLLLADCKPFSIYNPVRQLIGTNDVENELKPFTLQRILTQRLGGDNWEINENNLTKTVSNGQHSISATELRLAESDSQSVKKFTDLLDWFKPNLVVVAMGKTYDDNFTACEILKQRNIKHIIPSAFPGATHFKTIVVDAENTPCYECLQNNLRVDLGAGPKLNSKAREMFYTDPDDPTQPATIFETWPSAHNVLRLTVELATPKEFRSPWFQYHLDLGKNCFVGGNISLPDEDDDKYYVYGVTYPGQVIVYGVEDIAREEDTFVCSCCNRRLNVKYKFDSTERSGDATV